MFVRASLTPPGVTAKLLPQQKDSSCSMIFVARPRAFSNLEKSGVPATADVIAAIALYLSKASKLRFEIKFSPTRGLCLRAIAGHSSVLDRRQLPCLRLDEARRIAAAIHCTSWENVLLTTGASLTTPSPRLRVCRWRVSSLRAFVLCMMHSPHKTSQTWSLNPKWQLRRCLLATEEEAQQLGYATAFRPVRADCFVGRGHQDEIYDDLDPDTLNALDEFATRLSAIPDMSQAKDVLAGSFRPAAH